METVIYSQFGNRPHAVKEKVCKKSKVSMAGYVPLEETIRSMLAAGKRLMQARLEQYDFKGEEEVDVDEVDVDPTRSKDFDLVDAGKALEAGTNELKKIRKVQKEAYEKKQAEDKALLEKARLEQAEAVKKAGEKPA